jgi:hypothetical protein
MPYGGVYHGREAIVSNVFGPILADVEGFTAAPDEILPLDETRVAALGRHGHRGANGPMDARFVHIWPVTNGQGSRYQQLADTHTFRTAIGKYLSVDQQCARFSSVLLLAAGRRGWLSSLGAGTATASGDDPRRASSSAFASARVFCPVAAGVCAPNGRADRSGAVSGPAHPG